MDFEVGVVDCSMLAVNHVRHKPQTHLGISDILNLATDIVPKKERLLKKPFLS
jgi:hypothetical protein